MVMKDEFWQLSKTYHLNYLIRTTRILYFVVINKKNTQYTAQCVRKYLTMLDATYGNNCDRSKPITTKNLFVKEFKQLILLQM